MDGFDAELYLRQLGERMLIGPHERHHRQGSPLSTAALALVAVNAIDADGAEAILDDYGLATALRNGEFDRYLRWAHRAGRGAAPVQLTPRRIVPCDRVIEKGTDTLHVRSVTLDDDLTTVVITYRMQPAQPGARPARRRPRHGHAAVMRGGGGPGGHQITLVDDRQTKVGTQFRGGGSDQEWRGHLHADRPLARDTAWIEVDGERIEFEEAPAVGHVVIEQLPDEPPALRHLWRLVAAPNRFHGPPITDLEPAIEALTAAGALDPDDPGLADVRAVASMIDSPQHTPGAPRVRRLPEPWRSLLARQGRMDGPTGSAAIGLMTPVFDGIVVAAMSLESGEDAFEVEVEVTPDVFMPRPYEEWRLRRTLAWWARDDRGNHYLGRMGEWRGDNGGGWGDISFTPALDPGAQKLELMTTAETSRAVISFPLPWAAGEVSK